MSEDAKKLMEAMDLVERAAAILDRRWCGAGIDTDQVGSAKELLGQAQHHLHHGLIPYVGEAVDPKPETAPETPVETIEEPVADPVDAVEGE